MAGSHTEEQRNTKAAFVLWNFVEGFGSLPVACVLSLTLTSWAGEKLINYEMPKRERNVWEETDNKGVDVQAGQPRGVVLRFPAGPGPGRASRRPGDGGQWETGGREDRTGLCGADMAPGVRPWSVEEGAFECELPCGGENPKVTPYGTWDLSSLTEDRTPAPYSGSTES
ncbi:hypothetical protein MJT46_017341 [Ovis ammon polii x Ovis aries]|nr:hypothetical protein MJT46_017341 [Ovis ammon polii x Ovis aries]